MKHGVDYLVPKDFDLDSEDCLDTYIEVKNIRKGDIFYECIRGENHQMIALTNARRISDGWYCVAKNVEGEKAEIFYSDFTKYPGPNFHSEPQYLTEVDKKLVYIIN